MTVSPHLAELLETLWPGGSDAPPGLPDVRLVALPNARSPRVVLPGRPWRVSAGALRHYRTSATGVRRVAASAGSLGLRAGLGELMPGRLRRPAADGIDAHLCDVLGRQVHVSLYVGPQRAVQKPVLQVLDDTGRPIAFAKVAVNTLTTDLIRHEAAALDLLQDAGLTSVRVPRILHRGEWHSRELLVQEALVPTGRAEVAPPLLAEAAREISAVGGHHDHDLADNPYVADLRARVAALPPHAHSGALSSTLDAVLAAPGIRLTLGSWHGDWAPWNMAQAHGRVLVWDWEGFGSGVPVGFDACHHEVFDQVTFRGTAPTQAFRSLFDHSEAVLGPMGVEADARPWTALLYAVELATSYLENGEAVVAGTVLSRLDDWLDQTLGAGRSAIEQRVRS